MIVQTLGRSLGLTQVLPHLIFLSTLPTASFSHRFFLIFLFIILFGFSTYLLLLTCLLLTTYLRYLPTIHLSSSTHLSRICAIVLVSIRMTETYFFHSDIIGKEIHFFENYVSTWIHERKIGEMNDQLTALNYEEFQKASGAYGTFICSQRNNRNNVAIIKIFLQCVYFISSRLIIGSLTNGELKLMYPRVPYQGSERAIHAERARQATQTLPMAGQEQLDALRILTANHCVSTPTLLSQKIEQQSQDSPLVPGGFAVYLLIEHAQGIQLTEAIFWAFKRQERDRVREAVKSAWEYAYAFLEFNPEYTM